MNSTTVVNVRKDEYDVYIGRPSKWGNPFVIGKDGARDEVVAKYRTYLLANPILMDALPTLRGKRLGCYCAPNKLCHGSILAEYADRIGALNNLSQQTDELNLEY